MFKKTAYGCAVFLGAFVPFLRSENVTQPLINIYQIAEYHFNLIALMAKANGTHNYASFMDKALRAEVEDVFARIRGFAYNETEGEQWEKTAHQFLYIFILRTIATQGSAHLDAHFAHLSKNISEPHTLLEQCLSQIVDYIEEYLDEKMGSPYIADEILLYELIGLTKLLITAVIIDNPPYFQLRLTAPAPQRFFDDNQSSNSTPTQPTPYAPLKNYIKGWEGLRNVYNILDIEHQFHDLYDMDERLGEYIAADVMHSSKTYLAEFLTPYNLTAQTMKKIGGPLLAHTLLQILVTFLALDYNSLLCHPAYKKYAIKDALVERLIDQIGKMNKKQADLLYVWRMLWQLLINDFSKLVENFQSFLDARGVVARYIRRSPFILICFSPQHNTTNSKMSSKIKLVFDTWPLAISPPPSHH